MLAWLPQLPPPHGLCPVDLLPTLPNPGSDFTLCASASCERVRALAEAAAASNRVARAVAAACVLGLGAMLHSQNAKGGTDRMKRVRLGGPLAHPRGWRRAVLNCLLTCCYLPVTLPLCTACSQHQFTNNQAATAAPAPAVAALDRALTWVLLSQSRPAMCRTRPAAPGGGAPDTTLPLPSSTPLHCSVAPRTLSRSDPASAAASASGIARQPSASGPHAGSGTSGSTEASVEASQWQAPMARPPAAAAAVPSRETAPLVPGGTRRSVVSRCGGALDAMPTCAMWWGQCHAWRQFCSSQSGLASELQVSPAQQA